MQRKAAEEFARVDAYLHPHTRGKVDEVLQTHLIKAHYLALVQNGLGPLAEELLPHPSVSAVPWVVACRTAPTCSILGISLK